MCTVMLRFAPGTALPLLVAAVRDEFADRAWDPPGPHWPGRTPPGRSVPGGSAAQLIGGRDRTAGGTWLAVDPARPALAALLNGVRLPPPATGTRPSRGDLPLDLLAAAALPAEPELVRYNGFHLLLGTVAAVELWSWDGVDFTHRQIEPGDHILVNAGLDTEADPLVPHFLPLLRKLADPELPAPGAAGRPPAPADAEPERVWGEWIRLLTGDGLDPTDPRALIVRHEVGGRVYASTSAALVALRAQGVRYDFTGTPADPGSWYQVNTSP